MTERCWRLTASSRRCTISNVYGRFNLSVYELTNDHIVTCVYALTYGTLVAPVPLRINSGCVTGEIFGDQSCDCGWQLRNAFRYIIEAKQGIILYAPTDEGRGVGAIGKINSMALMQRTGIASSE